MKRSRSARSSPPQAGTLTHRAIRRIFNRIVRSRRFVEVASNGNFPIVNLYFYVIIREEQLLQ
jgi:hypothetical protein